VAKVRKIIRNTKFHTLSDFQKPAFGIQEALAVDAVRPPCRIACPPFFPKNHDMIFLLTMPESPMSHANSSDAAADVGQLNVPCRPTTHVVSTDFLRPFSDETLSRLMACHAILTLF